MTGYKPMVACIAVGCAMLAPDARAQDDAAALRAELQSLKSDYESRVASLEARLAQLETTAAAADVAPAEAVTPPAPASASASAFNPAISVVLAGSYADTSQDADDWRMAGFMPNGGEVGPGERSFNLGESELTVAASVDPYFTAQMTFAITGEDEIEVEEAFFRTTALPAGFTLKGGRFFSGFGYLNEVHAHAWDFADQPLVYQAFFANQRGQDGIQVKWIAPADLLVELGAETGNGDAFPGTRQSGNGLNGMTLFAHVGGDLGDNASWRAGGSWIDLDAESRTYEDAEAVGIPVLNAFTGQSETWVADAVLKWAPGGNSALRYLKLQGEYMHRRESGNLAFDVENAALTDSFRSTQSGWYLQGVYQFRPRWRAGIRYDALDSGDPAIGLVSSGVLAPADFPALLPGDPSRTTLMVDWNPSEFSRLRLQYAWDEARDTGDTDRQLFLQYLYGIGAHGAHKY
ncbi:MAG TPA: hypothetical protein VFR77_09575 [Steroidobacteraceae bacterium]|nr:hypothetical protein [Steroidobacteraceae bacterium]